MNQKKKIIFINLKVHKISKGICLHTNINYHYICNWSKVPMKEYSTTNWDRVTCINCLKKMKKKPKKCLICGKQFRTLNNKETVCEDCKREEYK